MKKTIAFAGTLFVVCGMCTAAFAETADESSASSVSAAESGAIEISTAEELAAIADDLSADYVLAADIDLEGMDWTPIGSFVPSGESEEEQETPSADAAFTGTFNGNGYTISNLTVSQPEDWALGLFGCISNAEVGNFTLSGASVEGSMMLADVVGYSHFSRVWDISLMNGSVSANATEMSAEGMYGGIVGAGMGSVIEGCRARADITIPDGTANAGIVGGGLEMTSVIGCQASGTVTAGNNCYGLGGISGCGFAAEEFTDCTANDVTITAGDDCFRIGGITGYAGGYEDESFGMPVTVLTNCTARNVTVTAGENADGVADIVGAGFFNDEAAKSMGAPFDGPAVFELVDCRAEELGCEIDFFDANQDAATQIGQIESAVTQGYDAILFEPVNPDGLVQAAKDAMDKGVVVVNIVSPITDWEENGISAVTWGDNETAGELEMKSVIDDRRKRRYRHPDRPGRRLRSGSPV